MKLFIGLQLVIVLLASLFVRAAEGAESQVIITPGGALVSIEELNKPKPKPTRSPKGRMGSVKPSAFAVVNTQWPKACTATTGNFEFETDLPITVGNGADPLFEALTVNRLTGKLVGKARYRCGAVPTPPPPPPTEEEVWELLEAQASEKFNTAITINPQSKGLTGLATIAQADSKDLSVSTSIRGYSVSAQAKPRAYQWNMGDGTESGQRIEHVYQRAGNKTITLSVTWAGSYTVSGLGSTEFDPVEVEQSVGYSVDQARVALTSAR